MKYFAIAIALFVFFGCNNTSKNQNSQNERFNTNGCISDYSYNLLDSVALEIAVNNPSFFYRLSPPDANMEIVNKVKDIGELISHQLVYNEKHELFSVVFILNCYLIDLQCCHQSYDLLTEPIPYRNFIYYVMLVNNIIKNEAFFSDSIFETESYQKFKNERIVELLVSKIENEVLIISKSI